MSGNRKADFHIEHGGYAHHETSYPGFTNTRYIYPP